MERTRQKLHEEIYPFIFDHLNDDDYKALQDMVGDMAQLAYVEGVCDGAKLDKENV